jgi:signal transduction histidine kinase
LIDDGGTPLARPDPLVRVAPEAEQVASEAAERRHLADALHDGPVQVLASIGIRLGTFRSGLDDPDQQHAVEALEDDVRRALRSMRSLILDLSPPEVDTTLEGPLRSYLDETFGPEVQCHLAVDQPQPLPHDHATAAFRIVQLALSNVRAHASAGTVRVSIAVDADGLRGEVVDDGVGAPAEVLLTSPPGHLGLRRMHEHAAAVGGWVRLASSPDDGVIVRFWMPLPEEP